MLKSSRFDLGHKGALAGEFVTCKLIFFNRLEALINAAWNRFIFCIAFDSTSMVRHWPSCGKMSVFVLSRIFVGFELSWKVGDR